MDVTDKFFRAVDAMAPGNVVASPYFDMLEGSRAIEMGNRRLDTGLIALDTDDIMFDASAAQTVAEVAGSMNHITRLLMLWFLGLSLPVTLLSNRYVLDLLQSYQRNNGQFVKTSLVNHRLHKESLPEETLYHALLVNKVLRAFVAGICKFSGQVREVALNVLYDEEDLTTRNMDLDLLSATESKVILGTINEAKEWLENQEEETPEILIDFLSLAASLVSMCDIVRSSITLFKPKEPLSYPCLDEIKTLALKFQKKDLGLGPENSVSKFVQADCNNKHIPYENFLLEREQAYGDLHNMVAEIEAFVTAFSKFENVRQLESYLRYTMAPRMTADYSAVSRGFYQLFFIRDDKSIAGLEESVGSIAIRLMESLCCAGTSVLDTVSWNIPEEDPVRKETMHRDALSKVGALLDDIENAMYKFLSNYGNNKCRQRQFDSQTIVLWDTLQFNAENIEFHLYSKYSIGDKMAPDSLDPALPITAFAFHTKLHIMLQAVLSGFELNLYKPFEASQMYWYASYLAENDHANVSIRVKQINKGKLASALSLAKKVKKAKAGPKKEELKRLHRALNETAVPQVQKNLQYIEQYLEPSILATQNLCLSISQIMLLYQLLGADLSKPPAIVDDEHLYNLRMKPWRSVEVPPCPSFKEFQDATEFYANFSKLGLELRKKKFTDIIGTLKQKLTEALQIFGGITDSFKNEEQLGAFFKGGEANAKQWFEKLKKTAVAYQVELGTLLRIVQQDGKGENYKVEVSSTYHAFFPIYSLIEKKQK